MFGFGAHEREALKKLESKYARSKSIIASLKACNAVVEFDLEGVIVDVNQSFLVAMGYGDRAELLGKSHAILCDPDTASAETRQLFARLARGEPCFGRYARRGKQSNTVWLRGTYVPLTHEGQVFRIAFLAHDVTSSAEERLHQRAILDALDRSLAVIEFSPDGTILAANQNFLAFFGYRLEEVQGKHHRSFCTEQFYRDHPNFWGELAHGSFTSGIYERRAKDGRILWLQATYNPVVDEKGRVLKIVKLASDITARIETEQATQQAAEIANTTSEETAQIAANGAQLLQDSVQISNTIASQIEDTARLVGELNAKSAEISAIVTTISSIAQQTNLLALNAAIEAARAGEHGRGFAVVADEVRNLASRTNTSTGEIDEMVKANQDLTQTAMERMQRVSEQAHEGSELINRAAAVIEEIREGAENVSKTVAALGHHR
ncbi:PAS/PAC domain [gamma proteobacterium HdN1]|nr:PAS/PAC domain [gamma proteobacterium HdN1]